MRAPSPAIALVLSAGIGCLLCARSAAADPDGRLVVATSAHGTFYFHGVLVPPPYVVAIGFNIESGDTIRHGIYINGIPLHPEPVWHPLSPGGEVDSIRAAEMRKAVRNSGIPPGTPPAQTARMLAAAYAGIPGLIDSARAVSETALVIYWTGSTKPDWRPLSGKPFEPPGDRTIGFLIGAREFASYLNPAMVVLATCAGEMTIPPLYVPELDAEIADARKGVVRKYDILRDPRVVAEFRNPQPLPTH